MPTIHLHADDDHAAAREQRVAAAFGLPDASDIADYTLEYSHEAPPTLSATLITSLSAGEANLISGAIPLDPNKGIRTGSRVRFRAKSGELVEGVVTGIEEWIVYVATTGTSVRRPLDEIEVIR